MIRLYRGKIEMRPHGDEVPLALFVGGRWPIIVEIRRDALAFGTSVRMQCRIQGVRKVKQAQGKLIAETHLVCDGPHQQLSWFSNLTIGGKDLFALLVAVQGRECILSIEFTN